MPLEPITFEQFGGLRLDQALNEVGSDAAIYLRDVDWDGTTTKIRSRDGFQKLKASEATGPYKGLFPHSSTRLLAVKRVSAEEVKIVALDRDGEEKTTAAWSATAAKSCFTRIGTPSASYTYGRAATTSHKVVRFDGTSFTEPTATVDGAGSKEMPKGNLMATWPDGGNRLVVANTGSEGGPNKASSSASHVWFSNPGAPESYESTAYVQLAPGDGEEITALTVYGGRVFAFKETKFFVFYEPRTDSDGKPVFDFYEVTLGEGARMKRATSELLAETSDQIACSAPDGVYFCTSNGIYWSTGGAPSKISAALKPLEEVTPFDGPMADLLDGESETFRWPATGVASLGDRLVVRRYEFMFLYDIPTDAWTCWRMPAVSMAVWHGLTGGGTEASAKAPGKVESTGTGVAWSNPENAKTENESFATAELTAASPTSRSLKATEFGFAVPEEATIAGISAAVVCNYTNPGQIPADGEVEDNEVKLVKAGTIEGTSQAKSGTWTIGVPSGTRNYGGTSNLWGLALTPANVNASNFGIALSAKGVALAKTNTARVDKVTLTVYYTLPSASGGVRPRLFCSQSKHVYWTGPSAEDDAETSDPAWQSGFYDLGIANEKSLTLAEVWGTGDVGLSVARNFGEVGTATTFELGEAIGLGQKNKSQTGKLFSHRLSGNAPWSVQRLTRYAEVEGNPGNER